MAPAVGLATKSCRPFGELLTKFGDCPTATVGPSDGIGTAATTEGPAAGEGTGAGGEVDAAVGAAVERGRDAGRWSTARNTPTTATTSSISPTASASHRLLRSSSDADGGPSPGASCGGGSGPVPSGGGAPPGGSPVPGSGTRPGGSAPAGFGTPSPTSPAGAGGGSATSVGGTDVPAGAGPRGGSHDEESHVSRDADAARSSTTTDPPAVRPASSPAWASA